MSLKGKNDYNANNNLTLSKDQSSKKNNYAKYVVQPLNGAFMKPFELKSPSKIRYEDAASPADRSISFRYANHQ